MGAAEALLNGGVILLASTMACYGLFGWPNRRALPRIVPHRQPPEAPHRRFEDLVARARVLGPRLRSTQPGVRFAKYDGLRQGYDAVLGELADELAIIHLLAVIPPGPALDAERTRVEHAIERAGVDLGLPLV
jgi:hypothetical protein